MTEAEWLNAVNPIGLLAFRREGVSQRKVLLFNIACCRRVGKLLTDEDRQAVEEFERSCDNAIAIAELEERYKPQPANLHALHIDGGVAVYAAFDLRPPEPGTNLRTRLADYRGWSISGLAYQTAMLAAGMVHQTSRGTPTSVADGATPAQRFQALQADFANEAEERREQSHLIRDVFGNPFRPVTLSPEWRTSTVLALAQQMYESRDFSAMPILADALQDAGCDNDDILNHCRDEKQVHVRGCWVVDLVLEKI